MSHGITMTTILLLTSLFALASAIQFHVKEEQRVPTGIGSIPDASNLRDLMSADMFSTLRYSLLSEGYKYSEKFTINEQSGILSTAVKLDRETLCPLNQACQLDLLVGVLSMSGDYFDSIPIVIVVEDTNDHDPAFHPSAIALTIPESDRVGTSYTITGATDPDIDSFAIQSYTLVSHMPIPFRFEYSKNPDNSFRLALILNNTLNRETVGFYQLQIVASDGDVPALSGTLRVNITVLDANDNAPEFSHETYEETYPEDISNGSVLLYVQALDLDAGVNGDVSYQFSSGTVTSVLNHFAVDDNGAITLIQNLDYEESTSYRFVIEAVDNGSQPQSSQTIVIINVEDINDNHPIIHFNLLSEIPENSRIGKFVSHVSVTDLDSGVNGEVDCRIHNPVLTLEHLQGNQYKILLNTELDRERIPVYNVSMTCADRGSPPLNAVRDFQLHVKDINDHKPIFLKSIYRATVVENIPVGTKVLTVTASDADSGLNGEIVYTLGADDDGAFSIDPSSGVISNKQPLDRETQAEHIFHVVAQDRGTPANNSMTVVIITLTDVNDFVPKFDEESYTLYITEQRPAHTIVGNVSAEDFDLGDGGVVRYQLKSLNGTTDDLPFDIDIEHGIISSKAEFQTHIINEFKFLVVAKDNGSPSLNSSVLVVVKVVDINDHDPVISFPHTSNDTVEVKYSLPINTVVTNIVAYDLDSGENARLRYEILQGDENNLFSIDRETGQISVAKEMKLHDIDMYNLVIAVSDHGDPLGVTWTHLNIKVIISNTTAVAQPQSSSHDNIVIIISLTVVTVLLAVAIIVTIFILKRKNKSFPRFFTRSSHSKNYDQNLTGGLSEMSHMSNASILVTDERKSSTGHSLSQPMFGGNTQNGTDPSMNPRHTSFVSSIDPHALLYPKACSSMVTTGPTSPDQASMQIDPCYQSPPSTGRYDNHPTPGPSNYASAGRLRRQVAGPLHPDPVDSHQIEQMLHKLDTHSDTSSAMLHKHDSHSDTSSAMMHNLDSHSDTSSGEITSDSGRGPSEEDVPNVRPALYVENGLSKDDLPHYPTKPNRSKSRPLTVASVPCVEHDIEERVTSWMSSHSHHDLNDGFHSNNDSFDRSKSNNSPFPGSISYQKQHRSPSDHSHCDITNISRIPHHDNNSFHGYLNYPQKQYGVTDMNNLSHFNVTADSSWTASDYYEEAPGCDITPPKSHHSPHTTSPSSRHYYHGNHGALSDITESVRDDDSHTTTSGSYVIDPEELVAEIDNLFFPTECVV